MQNELLFIGSLFFSFCFLFFAARRGNEWLFGSIVVNLILVAVFGAKLITIFGLTTNVGNVFYACVFLATHFLIERSGKQTAMKTIFFGTFFILFFSTLSFIANTFSGNALSAPVNDALSTLFTFSPRIIIASALAYVFSQYINIKVYEWCRKKTGERFLWMRINAANIVGQAVDSLLFFSIAFFDLAGPLLVQTILTGWLIKTIVVFLGTPLLYLDAYLKHTKQ